MKNKIILILVLLISFIIRISLLEKYPSGFNADEFSQGYTAYSLLLTGNDEWGEKFPIAPRAYGDYRSPLYTYLLIPFIKVIGLNEFAVRLPSAIYGFLSVILIYLLSNQIFKNNKISFISAILFAFSPWSISLSRGAFEANMAIFMVLLSIYLFYLGMEKKTPIFLSSIIFGLSFFSYYSARLFAPLCVVLLIIFNKNKFFKTKSWKIFILIFLCFLGLSFYTLMKGGTRVSDTSILNPTDKWQGLATFQYEGVYLGISPFFERVVNNKITWIVNQAINNYLGYFSIDYLFLKGASESTYGMIPGTGVLYLIDGVFIIYSLWLMVKTKNKELLLISLLLAISPIPAGLAKGERAANRSALMLPFLIILISFGIFELIKYFSNTGKQKIVKIVVSSIYLLSFLLFFEKYLFHAPVSNSKNMSYGWKQASEFLKQNQYEKIIISKNFSEPQIAISFYMKIDPLVVQKNSISWLEFEKKKLLFVDMLGDYSLENYQFRNFHFPEDAKLKNTLFIGKADDFSNINKNIRKIIYYPGPEEKVAFILADFDQK